MLIKLTLDAEWGLLWIMEPVEVIIIISFILLLKLASKKLCHLRCWEYRPKCKSRNVVHLTHCIWKKNLPLFIIHFCHTIFDNILVFDNFFQTYLTVFQLKGNSLIFIYVDIENLLRGFLGHLATKWSDSMRSDISICSLLWFLLRNAWGLFSWV